MVFAENCQHFSVISVDGNQAVVGLDDGGLIVERQDAIPNPAVEVREVLPDGTEFKAVWSHLRQSGVVVPVDDPTEPCYESEIVQFLRDVKEYAERGDVSWLTMHGRVYAAMEPA